MKEEFLKFFPDGIDEDAAESTEEQKNKDYFPEHFKVRRNVKFPEKSSFSVSQINRVVNEHLVSDYFDGNLLFREVCTYFSAWLKHGIDFDTEIQINDQRWAALVDGLIELWAHMTTGPLVSRNRINSPERGWIPFSFHEHSFLESIFSTPPNLLDRGIIAASEDIFRL